MTFRDREKRRLVPLKPRLFSAEACQPGIYRKQARDFCLSNDRTAENLHASVRNEAVRYFRKRGIPWHDGIDGGPSNHLCCSQSACVNFWFPFTGAPDRLVPVLRALGYDAVQMLPFTADRVSADDERRYIAFEWIGERNYLGEHRRSEVARDDERTRGANFTSLDFAFRFRRSDGRIQIVAGEWKYTESYGKSNLRFGRRGTDRLEIYRPSLEGRDCQIALGSVSPEALFFDPFDQLMRQQLLCSAIERWREMDADIVSLLHVAPAANRQLLRSINSPALRLLGSDIHEAWRKLVVPGRFRAIRVECLLSLVRRHASDPDWAAWMELRYGGMR